MGALLSRPIGETWGTPSRNLTILEQIRACSIRLGLTIQWDDPQSRDAGKPAEWGKGSAASSGEAIGVAEVTKRRLHTRGAVGVASPTGRPQLADSQIYVTLAPRPDLDGHYTVFGRLVDGDNVPG